MIKRVHYCKLYLRSLFNWSRITGYPAAQKEKKPSPRPLRIADLSSSLSRHPPVRSASVPPLLGWLRTYPLAALLAALFTSSLVASTAPGTRSGTFGSHECSGTTWSRANALYRGTTWPHDFTVRSETRPLDFVLGSEHSPTTRGNVCSRI